jgi:uncharacterized protein
MKPAHLITLILVIIGGLNWGLVGVLNWDLVAAIFGSGSLLARSVYVVVALSAIWQLVALATASSSGQATVERHHSAH